MTKSNGFVYFDDAVVRRTSDFYKVVLEEEEVTIFKKVSLVEDIVAKTRYDENLIAILLAQIEFIRRDNAKLSKKIPRRINNENIIRGVSILLESVSIEELISKVKSSNWHELVNAFEAEDPIDMLKL